MSRKTSDDETDADRTAGFTLDLDGIVEAAIANGAPKERIALILSNKAEELDPAEVGEDDDEDNSDAE